MYYCAYEESSGEKDSDGDGIPDTIDEKPFSKDIVDIAYLGKYNYLSILDPNGNCLMGGNQGWWKMRIRI